MHKISWFTLIEVLVVIVIMSILLSMTIFFGGSYIKDLQLRSEKESVVNLINYSLSYAKSTNYFEGTKFTSMDILLSTWWVTVTLDGGSTFWEVELVRSTLALSWTNGTISITPYQRWCVYVDDPENELVSFTINSTVDTNQFCFEWDMNLCKLFLTICP